jgi:hypothetical protein
MARCSGEGPAHPANHRATVVAIATAILFICCVLPFAILFICRLLPNKVVTSGMGIPYHNPRYEEEIFPLTTHEFEGHELPVPGNADAHLRHIYGDYMQLPDLNKLAPHMAKLEMW